MKPCTNRRRIERTDLYRFALYSNKKFYFYDHKYLPRCLMKLFIGKHPEPGQYTVEEMITNETKLKIWRFVRQQPDNPVIKETPYCKNECKRKMGGVVKNSAGILQTLYEDNEIIIHLKRKREGSRCACARYYKNYVCGSTTCRVI